MDFSKVSFMVILHSQLNSELTFEKFCKSGSMKWEALVEMANPKDARQRVTGRLAQVTVLQCVAVCCGVLQCIAVCYGVLQCVEMWCGVLRIRKIRGSESRASLRR